MRTKCVKCGTALHGKNAQDMGICLECYNIEQSANFEEEPEGIRTSLKLNGPEKDDETEEE